MSGQLLLVCALRGALALNKNGGRGTYLGLILSWSIPFLLLLWYVKVLAFAVAGHLRNQVFCIPISDRTTYDKYGLTDTSPYSISLGGRHNCVEERHLGD